MSPSRVPGRAMTADEILQFLSESLAGFGRPNERVLVVVPDGTRTIVMVTVFDGLCACLAPRVKELTFLVALGTHLPMTDREDDGILVVPNAGEMLFRLADGTVPDVDSL